jgi:hypothetical protein
MSTTTNSPNEASPQPRRRWRVAIAVIVVAIVAVGLLALHFFNRSGHNWIAGPPALKANAKELKRTLVTPHLEASVGPGKNVLWCSTFQLVWNESCRLAGGDLHLEQEPPLVPILNKKSAQQSDVDLSSCLVMSGRVEDGVVAKIHQELMRKFAGQADPDLLNSIESRLPKLGYLAYSYLFRQLPFEYPFRRLDEPLTFGSRQVASFGLRRMGSQRGDHRIANQVKVLDYENDDSFIVELRPEDQSERIVLAKLAPADTLQKTIDAVHARIASTGLEKWKKMFRMGESVVIPIFNFDLLQEYDELYGKPITTAGPLQGMPIVLAMQSIRFRLDERGAILKSEAAMAKSDECGQETPRQLIFDKPFLVLLERRDASQPYFALWVDNSELLVPLE